VAAVYCDPDYIEINGIENVGKEESHLGLKNIIS